jgi:hypothetical protein
VGEARLITALVLLAAITATAATVWLTGWVAGAPTELRLIPASYMLAGTILGLAIPIFVPARRASALAVAYTAMTISGLVTGAALRLAFFPEGEYDNPGAARGFAATFLLLPGAQFLAWPFTLMVLGRRGWGGLVEGLVLAGLACVVLIPVLLVVALISDLILNACCR